MSNIFEKIDQCDLEIKKEKRRKRYRLCIYNSLYQNGHIARMGDPTLTWLVLGDKCTATATINGKVAGYLVYNGQWCKTLIDELAKIRGKSKKAIERDLKHLKKVKRIDYQRRRGVGARIVVYPIPGTFERSFKAIKDIGRNDPKQRAKRPLIKVETTFDKSQSDLYQNDIGKEKPKEKKKELKTGKNGSALYKDLNNKDKNNNKDVAAVVSQIFKGTVKTDKVKDRIQGKNPDEVIALARYCQEESSAKNPVGLFFNMLKESTKPPAPATKTRPKIPKPAGGYQTGREPHFDSSFYMSCVPEQAITIAQQKFPKDIEKAVERLLVIYHKKFDPRDYYKSKEQLTEEESKNMVEIIEKWEKIPD
ncbi:hypothetical protein ES705_22607 [subsurface metagenome]